MGYKNNEYFIELGLSDDECALLSMPFSEMQPEILPAVFTAHDRYIELLRERNRHFVPAPVKRIVTRPISDCLGDNVNGMQSMADGKYYDSRSAYYKSLKEKGCEIVGNEKPKPQTEVKGDFCTQKDVYDAIKQLGG